MADVTLRGMTWAHSRGFDPMVATSAAYAAAHPGVTITWEQRSLQAFADQPIGTMADSYDLIVIDHPHVGEVARAGLLVDLNGVGCGPQMAALAAGSVGHSHPSYQFDAGQWALAIDTATPVACFRPDRIGTPPRLWAQVLDLARAGQVGFALVPINALMTFMGIARNLGLPLAEGDELLPQADTLRVLDLMAEVVARMDPRCLTLDPIGIYEWMGRTADAPGYSPFGYGYTNYSRAGYCPYPLQFTDAPGIARDDLSGTVLGGTGIAVSSRCAARDVAVDYAFWIAGAQCQKGLYFASGGQPGHAAAWEDDACNAASRDFFRATRATLEGAWLRPRHDGYMAFQDKAGDVVHACLRAEVAPPQAAVLMNTLWRESRG